MRRPSADVCTAHRCWNACGSGSSGAPLPAHASAGGDSRVGPATASDPARDTAYCPGCSPTPVTTTTGWPTTFICDGSNAAAIRSPLRTNVNTFGATNLGADARSATIVCWPVSRETATMRDRSGDPGASTAVTRNLRLPAIASGCSCRSSPARASSVVAGRGSPPDAATRCRPPPNADAKTIVLSSSHTAPNACRASASAAGVPPATAIFFSLPSAKNPIDDSSGEKNGAAAPSVPATGSARTSSSARTNSRQPSAAHATNASRSPLGDHATAGASASSAEPGGSATSKRATGSASGASGCARRHVVVAAVAPSSTTIAHGSTSAQGSRAARAGAASPTARTASRVADSGGPRNR